MPGCGAARLSCRPSCLLPSFYFLTFSMVRVASNLHGRPQYPGREFILAHAMLLAHRARTRRHLDDAPEDLLAGLLHRHLAIEDGAAVDVHVLAHAAVHRAVGGQLQRWRG